MTTTEERLAHLEGAYEHVATKADLKAETGSVRTELANVRIELANLRAEMKSDIGSLLKWLYGLMVTVVAAGVAAALINLLT